MKLTSATSPPQAGKRAGCECPLVFHADNESMIAVCNSGKNPTMRHIGRTHGISIAWLNQETTKDYCLLEYIDTADMAADIFTKFYPEKKKDVWVRCRKNINVLTEEEIKELIGTPGAGYESVKAKLTGPKPAEGIAAAAAHEIVDLGTVPKGLARLAHRRAEAGGDRSPTPTCAGCELLLTNGSRKHGFSGGSNYS